MNFLKVRSALSSIQEELDTFQNQNQNIWASENAIVLEAFWAPYSGKAKLILKVNSWSKEGREFLNF